MALFENFPYTNLHELNLDWLIDVLNQLKDASVISVNGQTGDVILYQDPSVMLPNITERTWSFFRTADNVVRGITFSDDGNAYIINGNQLNKVYASNNTPDFDAQYIHLYSLNDEEIYNWNIYRNINGSASGIQFDTDGSAYIMSGNNRYRIYSQHDAPPYPVQSVNGETGQVILYKSNQVRLPDIIDEAGTVNPTEFWNIFRYLNGGYYGIQFNVDGTAELITANGRYTIYTTDNLPEYPAEPFDDLDVDILQITEPASLTKWGIIRETENGDIGISFELLAAGPSTYLRYYDAATDSYREKKILTIDDIPSSSGVTSVNGMAGVVFINGGNLPVSQQDNTPINDIIAVKANSTNIAYYEPGNTATNNIPAGSYVIWNNIAYIASQAISIGDTLSTNNLTALTSGITNDLNERTSVLEQLPRRTTYNTSTSVNVNDNTITNLVSAQLTPGKYLFIAAVIFTSNANGFRRVGISKDNNSIGYDRYSEIDQTPLSGQATKMDITIYDELTTTETFYLNVLQNSGSSLSTTGGMKIIKLA